MSSPVRIATSVDGMDPTAWPLAVACAEAIIAKAGSAVTEVLLLTPTRHQLERTTLSAAIGEPAAKALRSGRPVGFASPITLSHVTMRTMQRRMRGAVLIVFYADDEMLEEVDGLDGLAGVVVVPDMVERIGRWTARWNPLVPGQSPRQAETLIDDPVVEAALASLSGWINLSHAILNPRDKTHADETLRILRAKGHALDGERIASWAMQNGWKPGAARELGTLARKIAGLKSRPSMARIRSADTRYASWTE